jgi:hypothetical protein
MGSWRRLILGSVGTLACLLWATTPVLAATKAKPIPVPKPTPPGQARKAPTTLPPLVFQVNPVKVNPAKQPNIVIIGQHLSPTTRVQVGGRAATTIQAPDAQTLLVQLPADLTSGSYQVAVSNEGGTTVADDQLLVDTSGSGPGSLTMMAGAGLLLFFVLVMRLARTPGLS